MLISASQRATWDRMKTENHPFYQMILGNAVGARYSDHGRWPALAYTITGDPQYVPISFASWKASWPYGGSNADSVREFTIDYAVTYEMLKPGLTAAEETESRVKLIAIADKIVKGTLTSDSDQTTGSYLGLLCIDAVLGTSYGTGTFLDSGVSKPVGGYVSTGADRTTMRNAISLYVAMAEGGAWPEGTMYNPNTIGHLLRGTQWIAHHTGVDYFPEVTAFRTAYARVMMHEFTPNLKDQFQWGDIQKPHQVDFAGVPDIFSVMSGCEPAPLGEGLRQLESEIYAANNVTLKTGGNPLYARYMWFLNPYGGQQAWQPLAGGTSRVARGVGVLYARHEDRGLHLQIGDLRKGTVDHWQGLTIGDVRLTRNALWPIDHPLAYAADYRYYNVPLIANRGPNGIEASGLVGHAHVPGQFTYASGLSCGLGPDIFPGFWQPPPNYGHETGRTVFWLMEDDEDILLVHDRRHADDPRNQKMANGSPAIDRYYANVQTAFRNMLGLKATLWHSPTAPLVSADKKQLLWMQGETVVTVDQILPTSSPTLVTVNEKTGIRDDTGAALVPPLGGNIYDEQKKFLTYSLTGGEGFDTVLTVITAYEGTQAEGGAVWVPGHLGYRAVPTYAPLEVGDMEGVTITRPGKSDVVVLFSRRPGPTLSNTFDSKGVLIFDRTKLDTVKAARTITTPPALTLTPGATVYLADLDKAITSVTINGTSQPLTWTGDLATAVLEEEPIPPEPPVVTKEQELINRIRKDLDELDALVP